MSSTGNRSAADSVREPAVTTTKKKILVVDDSFSSLSTQQGTLSAYDVVLARNGREGIRQAITERPDLILMDVNMPGMDGFQACRWLRAFEATKAVPIIIMTTRADPQSVKVAYANGCNGYLVKPFKEEELLTTVRKLLSESEPGTEA
ncbi:response regulator [Chondromyces apiculatus]|uniref:Twitching motility protein PilH n=1 Tax=Chondromyces apiculatus DSM 436 TaxID=1192034 RepID=A0A017SYY0_9BACT|nr:response regulator [Chondromyces apiculatus]EYF02189.1 twitching motility protein PilH [Chondromyces apiculatus DSM 436]